MRRLWEVVSERVIQFCRSQAARFGGPNPLLRLPASSGRVHVIRLRLGLAHAVLFLGLAGCQRRRLPQLPRRQSSRPSLNPPRRPPANPQRGNRFATQANSARRRSRWSGTGRIGSSGIRVPAAAATGEIELWCHSEEYGITERNEAFADDPYDAACFPAEGPRLTPWMTENVARGLMGGVMHLDSRRPRSWSLATSTTLAPRMP